MPTNCDPLSVRWVWRSMVARCTNPNHPKFHRYGGRGIRVCRRWLKSFAAFVRDVGPRPGPEFSLDRRNNDGHYTQSNCRWADRKAQARNRSTNRVVEFRGLRLPAVELCERLGVDYDRFRCRLRWGWPVERAILEPIERRTMYKYKGKPATLRKLAQIAGVTRGAMCARLRSGLSVNEAIALKKYERGRKAGKRSVATIAADANTPTPLVKNSKPAPQLVG